MEYDSDKKIPTYSNFLQNVGPSTIPSPTIFTAPLNNAPWNLSMMPWTVTNMNNGIMEFTGSSNTIKPPDFIKNNFHCKRKSEMNVDIPSKHLITEEKMVAHMNGLHISQNFISHNIDVDLDTTESSMNTHISMSQSELEQKLKNAQSITVCEEIKKLGNDPIIPKILLERMEKPCTALVVWQPPRNLQNVYDNVVRGKTEQAMSLYNSDRDNNDNRCEIDDECPDNNNSTTVDLNNCMDLDV